MSANSAYRAVRTTKLSFKNDKKTLPVTSTSRPSLIKKPITATPTKAPVKDESLGMERVGTGRITTSGTTVHGHGTNFSQELRHGDALLVVHPVTGQVETKIVRMVLSSISLSISSSFSSDLITTTPFKYIQAPRETTEDVDDDIDLSKLNADERKEREMWRRKGIRPIEDSSREDLLTNRIKKKSDRFC